jgi:hypothetical protein
MQTMTRAFFQLLRRRRRLLVRPVIQTTLLRLHRAISNHPKPLQQLSAHRGIGPANDTPAGHDAFDETPRCDAVTYAGMVGLHLRCGDLLRVEDLFHAAPASARDPYVNAVMLDS